MSYAKFRTLGGEGDRQLNENIFQVPRIITGDDRNRLIQTNRIVVIDNYTDWCGPCKECGPKFAQLASKYAQPGLCAFAKENVEDKCPGCPTIYGVPCFHFYVNGRRDEQLTVTGADISKVADNLNRLLTMNNKI